MHYFAGFFDAEGWVSLTTDGNYRIGIEVSHRPILEAFKNKFGGHLYDRKVKTNKYIYHWVITNGDEIINFINLVGPFARVKQDRCKLLKDYISQSQNKRRATRRDFSHQLAELKKPRETTKEELRIPQTFQPEEDLWKWMAGFMDGDGNFCIYVYQQKNKGARTTYDSWISIFNTFPEPILYVQSRIKGSISSYKGTNFPIWKWVCSQSESEFVCNSLEPYLIVKKEQCRLVAQYLAIHKTKIRGVDHSFETICKIQKIIKQIKHQNSL